MHIYQSEQAGWDCRQAFSLGARSLAAVAVRPVSELLCPGSAPHGEPSIIGPIHLGDDSPGPCQAELLRCAAFEAMLDANNASRKSPVDWTEGTPKTELGYTTLPCLDFGVAVHTSSLRAIQRTSAGKILLLSFIGDPRKWSAGR